MEQASGTAAAPQGRPVAITVFCVVGFVGAVLSGFLVFSDVARQVAPWYPLFLGVATVIGLACMVGLWLMRKWAVYTYTAFAAVNQVILLATGLWTPMAFVLPAVLVVVMFIYLSRMR